jgi:hypothetical protein
MKKLLAFIILVSTSLAQTIPPPREATAAQATDGTAGHVFISPRRLAGNDVRVGDLTVTGDDVFGVLGLNLTASTTTNKNLTLSSSGTTGNIVFKSGSTTQGTFVGGGGLLMAGATGGNPSLGVINAAGLQINGVDLSPSTDTYWNAISGGISYASNVTIGDTLKLTNDKKVQWGDGSAYITGNGTSDIVTIMAPSGLAINGASTFSASPTAPDYLLGASGPSVSSSLASRGLGQALYFSGTGYPSFPSSTIIGLGDYAVAIRLRPSVMTDGGLWGGTGVTPCAYMAGATGHLVTHSPGVGIIGSSAAGAVELGKSALAVYVRASGRGQWYVDGKTNGSDFADTLNLTAPMIVYGTAQDVGTFDGGELTPIAYLNRALTASEVRQLAESGLSPSDLPATPAGTALITGNDSTFDGAGNWTGNGNTVTISGGKANVTTAAFNQGAIILSPWQKGVRYRLTVTVGSLVGGTTIKAMEPGLAESVPLVSGTNVVEFTSSVTNASAYLYIVRATDAVTSYTLDDVTLIPLGALAAYSDQQPGRGPTWFDVSGNSAHLTLGTGTTWARPASLTTPLGGGATLAATDAGAVSITPTTGQLLSTPAQIASTVTTGTAPLIVASTTNVANLNASSLNGATFASPGPIGSTTPSTGTFTTGTFAGAVSGITTLGLSGVMTSTNDTDATAIDTGSIQTAGGASIKKALFVGGALTVQTNKALSFGGNFTTSGAYNTTLTTTGNTSLTLPTSGTLATTTDLIAGAQGGTGVVNTGKTITLGGNLTTSGAYATTLTATNTTSVTLPTSGTLLSSAAAVTGAQGGTGVVNTGKTITLGGSLTTSGAYDTTLTTTGTTGVTIPTSGTLLSTAAPVTVAQGGTGLATLTANNVMLGNGTSAVQFVAPGTSGNVLTSNGTTWASSPGVTSTYAEIYVADGTTAQSISTGATYAKLTAFTTDGISNNCTAAAASDKITFTASGVYRVTFSISLTSDTNNVSWHLAPFLGGAEQAKGEVHFKNGTGADIISGSGSLLLNVSSVPVDLDIRARHESAGSVLITPTHANLSVSKIN